MEEILKKVYELLKSKKIFAEVGQFNSLPVIEVRIEMGDWKHEHLRCKLIMQEEGYVQIGEQITHETGEDVYSSAHYFLKA